MRVLKAIVFLLPVVFFITSCQKEIGGDLPPGGGNGGGGGGGGTGNCNTSVKKLKRWQATFDTAHYIAAEWNGDGTIKWLKLHVLLSDRLIAHYSYSAGKINEAVLYDINTYDLVDTVVYRYNAAGLVDSLYMKGRGRAISLKYNGNKLIKLAQHETDGSIMYYWDVVCDANGNVTRAEEFWEDGSGGFEKASTYTFTRDDKKNPLAGLAPYLIYLDDEYQSFWYWGPNNFVDQRAIDHTGTGLDLTTGYKFKYDGNCYPVSSQNTIMGQTIFPDDDFTFTYW